MTIPTLKKRKLGYLSCYQSGIEPFQSLFPGGGVNVLKDGMDSCSAILLWGGTDIHPSYYQEKAHYSSQVYGAKTPSKRDQDEWRAMVYAKANNIPIIGVCRGAQFLCVFAGGRLIQDVSGHGSGSHLVSCLVNGEVAKYETTSCHHQMMYPYNVDHVLLAASSTKKSVCYSSGPGAELVDMTDRAEPEVVYFPSINGFAIQGHPEWMNESDAFVQWCLSSIEEHCFSTEENLNSKEIICA